MNKLLTECKIRVAKVETTFGGLRLKEDCWWECSCGAEGNIHDTHQRAIDFGIEHLKIMSDSRRIGLIISDESSPMPEP